MKSVWISSWVLLLACIFIAGAGTAPANSTAAAPTMSKADQAMENESLRVGNDDDSKSAAGGSKNSTAETSSNASDMIRVLCALAIVVAVILLLRTGVRRMASLPGGGKTGKLVTVLSRSMIAPRQQILVLQIGKRLLVVGDSGGAMSALCELNDPDEIASLIGQTRTASDEKAERGMVSFGSIFKRATEPFDEAEAVEEPIVEKPESSVEPVSMEDMGGLLDKVRLLQEQFKARAEGGRT